MWRVYPQTMTDHPAAQVDAPNYRIMTVCLGNICRSPMAEAVLRRKVAEVGLAAVVSVESSGTAGWHQGHDADPRARATLQQHGYSLQHSARQFHRAWFDAMDLILAMDRSNFDDLHDLASRSGAATAHVRLLRTFDPAASGEEVPDPYYGGPEGFVDVLRMVEAASDGVVAHVQQQLRDGP
jgi:protein-tyrosine phosphatase